MGRLQKPSQGEGYEGKQQGRDKEGSGQGIAREVVDTSHLAPHTGCSLFPWMRLRCLHHCVTGAVFTTSRPRVEFGLKYNLSIHSFIDRGGDSETKIFF